MVSQATGRSVRCWAVMNAEQHLAPPASRVRTSNEGIDRTLASLLRARGIAVLPIESDCELSIAPLDPAWPVAHLVDIDGRDLSETAHPLSRIRRNDTIHRERFRLLLETGEACFVELSTVSAGAIAALVAIDVTADHNHDFELRRLAETDDLTGVANRRSFTTRLNAAILRHRSVEEKLAVLAVNLDGFRLLADSTGTELTRMIVKETARRLASVIREDEAVAFFGGDRFVVMIEPVSNREDAVSAAERIRRAINVPMTFGRREFSISACIGVAYNSRRTDDADQLLANADAAVRTAKEQGRNDWAVFDDMLRTRTIARLHAEATIDDALRQDRIAVEYQPIVDATSRVPVAFEALARIRREGGSLLAPSSFLQVAEETGRIRAIDLAMLDQACDEVKRLVSFQARSEIQMSVNLSSQTMRRPDLHSVVFEAAEEHGLDPQRLMIEFSETVLLDADTATKAALEELRADGVTLIIDGHGDGPIGLGHISRFPISTVKLDGRFVQGATTSVRDRAVIRAVVEHAHAVGIRIIAKSVETAEQADVLKSLGCDQLQGFFFGRPMTGPDAERFLVS